VHCVTAVYTQSTEMRVRRRGESFQLSWDACNVPKKKWRKQWWKSNVNQRTGHGWRGVFPQVGCTQQSIPPDCLFKDPAADTLVREVGSLIC